MDFILYGERGLKAVEVKLSDTVRPQDYKGLLEFLKDYPKAKLFLLYTGRKSYTFKDIHVVPVEKFLKQMTSFI